jgi:hypothetical protein
VRDGLGVRQPFLPGSQERRHLDRKFIVDRIFVAADAVGLRISLRNRSERFRQGVEITGVLQPTVPYSAPRPAQPPDRGLVVSGMRSM